MNKIILTLLLTVSNVFANTYVGVVKDVSTGSPIADANIVVSGIEEIGLTTNEKGFFSLHTDTDSIMIRVNAIGYTQYNQSYNTNENEFIYISMDKKSIELSPVEVIADRTSLIGATKNFFRLAGSSSLISRAEVIEFNDTDINRVISQVPGVYTQEEDGYGLRPNIGMRGSGLERSAKINMMEDGIPIAPAPYSSPAAYYSPTAGRMESFEIRKGSSQIKYGPHSTGGAINYISASIPEKLKFQGTVSTGSFGTSLGKFKTGVSSKNYGIMFQTYLDKTDGFKSIDGGDETGFSKNDYLFKARLKTNREFAAAELKISQTNEVSNETYLGLIRSDFAKDPFRRYRASQKDQMSADHNQISLTGALKLFRNTNITAALYQNGFHRNWYKLNKVGEQSISSILSGDESDVGYQLLSAENSADDVYDIKANNRDYKSQGLQSILRSEFKINNINNSLMFGLRIHYDEMDRFQWSDFYKMENSNLLITTAGTQGIGSKNNRLYTANARSVFIENEIKINNTIITAGSRFESIDLERSDWGSNIDRDSVASLIKSAKINVVVPGIGISHLIKDGLNLFCGIHTGFSPPGPGIDDEDDVLPEESVNSELGLRYNNGLNSFEFLYFYNDYKNLLGEDTESTGSGTYAQFNGGKVLINGIEFSLNKMYVLQNVVFPISMSYTYTDARFFNSFDSEFGPWGDVSVNDELPYIPKNMFHLRLGFELNKLKLYSRFKHVANIRTVAGQGAIDPLHSTDQINIVDLVLKYRISQNFMFESKILNLFNDKSIVASRPAGVRPNMPRNINFSFLFDF